MEPTSLTSYHPSGGEPWKVYVIDAARKEDALRDLLVERHGGQLTDVPYLAVTVNGATGVLTAVASDGTHLIINKVGLGDIGPVAKYTALMLDVLGLGDYAYFLPRLQAMDPKEVFKQGMD